MVEEREWTPPAPKYPASEVVALRIRAEEKEMQKRVKAAGGTWDKERQLWDVMYGCIAGTVLEARIVKANPEDP